MLKSVLILTLSLSAARGAGSLAQVPAPHAASGQPPHAATPTAAVVHALPNPHTAAPPAATPQPLASGARLAPGTPIPPAELEAFVDGVVREAMVTRHIVGVSVSVVQNGQVVLKKGYGFGGAGRRVDPDQTLFRIGTISKTFTWIALMREVEAGRMRLADPINRYLPDQLQIGDQSFNRTILIRDLMTHSAGFEDRALGQLFEEDPSRIRPMAEYLREERPRRVREAGALPVDSNYGAMLAGEAASYVEGRPYQDLIESEIIAPLGLGHTTFREPYPARAELPRPMPSALVTQISPGYRWTTQGYQPQSFEFITQGAPAGAASSTAGDMARYMQMILNGGQLDGAAIYGPDAAKGFRTTLQAAAAGVDGWDDGFMEFTLPGGFRGVGHDGDTMWFHSAMVTVPDLNLGVFVTTNTDTGSTLAAQLPQRIVERFYAPPPAFPRSGVPSLVDDRAVYAGTYLNDRRPYRGLEKFVSLLIGQMKVSVTKDGRLLTSVGHVAQAWVPNGPPGHFLAVDGQARSAFEISHGRAVRWFDPTGTTAFDRIGTIYHLRVLELMAALTAFASASTLIGLAVRDRREFRQTPTQARASLVQTTVSILWLIAMVSFALWAAGAGDTGKVMYDWPGPPVLIASACALVGAMLTLVAIVMTPVVWRGGRRLDSWTAGRKSAFSATNLIFGAFALQLLLWGALAPWSG